MEFLRRIIAQIKAQLGELTTSQRLVVGLLAVIVVGAAWWMVNYAAARETVPLLDQPFSEAEITRVVQTLSGWQVEYEVRGNKIYVPRSEARKLLYRLTAEQVLPEDISIGWERLIEGSDILVPDAVHQDKRLIVRQVELARTISHWPHVASARVYINPGGKRVLAGVRPVPSASVDVEMELRGSGTRKLAKDIAHFIAGANNRMRAENVAVLIDGKSFPVNAHGEGIDSEYLENKIEFEQHFRDKIVAALGIDNAHVQVDVTLNTTKKETRERLIPDEGGGSWNPQIEKTSLESKSSTAQQDEEPGMLANVSETPVSTGTSKSDTNEEGSATSRPYPGEKVTVTSTPSSGIKEITATVRIPRTFFARISQQESGTEEDPPAETVAAVIEREIPKLRRSVMGVLGLVAGEEENVVVDSYWDVASLAAAGGGASGPVGSTAELSAGKGAGSFAQRHAKQIAVSALAVISLFMVLMMVRKASGPVDLSEEQAASLVGGNKPPEALSVEESNLAEAGDGALLAGVELEEEAIRSQQILQQIRSMVEESPESAATLLRKWIVQDS